MPGCCCATQGDSLSGGARIRRGAEEIQNGGLAAAPIANQSAAGVMSVPLNTFMMPVSLAEPRANDQPAGIERQRGYAMTQAAIGNVRRSFGLLLCGGSTLPPAGISVAGEIMPAVWSLATHPGIAGGRSTIPAGWSFAAVRE